jgi:hypothetical protein
MMEVQLFLKEMLLELDSNFHLPINIKIGNKIGNNLKFISLRMGKLSKLQIKLNKFSTVQLLACLIINQFK